MAASAILDFQKIKIFMDDLLKGVNMRHHANFMKIGHTVADMAILGFQNGHLPPSWIVKFKFFNGRRG